MWYIMLRDRNCPSIILDVPLCNDSTINMLLNIIIQIF